ncbi:hypothetical protein N7478_011909 [Penicillium angulare]|uniref:uncharacterized protein n=1 Tax=Penicillium angulare TaxID=116970 RepID=UPI00253F7C9A|nr:uncharacterized protein N7478_011909 [Penicillium angulare]KAJ5261314.1 hypothetical protein N7478_011909 [Penicillium angulare]
MFTSLLSLLLFGAYVVAAPHSVTESREVNGSGFYSHIDSERFVVAAIKAEPYENSEEGPFQSNWDIAYSTEKAVRIIKKAANDGFNLLTFP